MSTSCTGLAVRRLGQRLGRPVAGPGRHVVVPDAGDELARPLRRSRCSGCAAARAALRDFAARTDHRRASRGTVPRWRARSPSARPARPDRSGVARRDCPTMVRLVHASPRRSPRSPPTAIQQLLSAPWRGRVDRSLDMPTIADGRRGGRPRVQRMATHLFNGMSGVHHREPGSGIDRAGR